MLPQPMVLLVTGSRYSPSQYLSYQLSSFFTIVEVVVHFTVQYATPFTKLYNDIVR